MVVKNNNSEQIQIIADYYEKVCINKIVTVLNSSLENIYCTDKYAQMLGLKKEDLIMRNLANIPSVLKNEYIDSTIHGTKHHLKTIFDKKLPYFQAIVKLNTVAGWKLFVVKASSVMHDSYILEFEELQINLMNEILYMANIVGQMNSDALKKFNNKLQDELAIEITEDEKIILFLLSIGKPYKVMSTILSSIYGFDFNESKIKSILINKLFPKFNVETSVELVAKYLSAPFYYNIPSGLTEKINFACILSITPLNNV